MERFLIHRFISWTSFILNLIVSEAKSLPQVELSSSTSFKDCLVLHSVALDAMSQVPTPSFASSKSFTRAKSLTVDIFLNNRTVFPALLQHILNSLTEGAPSSSIAVLLGSCLDFAMQQKIQLNSADQVGHDSKMI